MLRAIELARRSSKHLLNDIFRLPNIVVQSEIRSATPLGQLRFYAGPTRRPFRRRRDEMPTIQHPLRNQQISAAEVRVVFPEEDNRPTEVLQTKDAIGMAATRSMDLVLVSPTANPPVARMVKWEKIIYTLQQKNKAAAKQQREAKRLAVPKEVRLGCHTALHDFQVKLNQAKKFLEEGHNIKLAVTFTRGWQIEDGRKMVHKFLGELGDTVTVRDPAHLLRPRMHHWAVQLSPAATILKKET